MSMYTDIRYKSTWQSKFRMSTSTKRYDRICKSENKLKREISEKYTRETLLATGTVTLAAGTVHCAVSTVHAILFIHRCRFSTPCGHHAGQQRGCCPPCSARGHRQGGRGCRGAGRRCPSPRPGRPPPPRGVQGRRLGADGYSCPSARAIFVFIVVFPGRGLTAHPHRLFDLQRYGRRWTSPSGGRNAQRPPAGEHRPRLLHQLHQLA
jgi:hypothetical protein